MHWNTHRTKTRVPKDVPKYSVASAASKERRKLLALPGDLGYKTVAVLIKALREAAGATVISSTPASRGKHQHRRAKVTPKTKAKLKLLAGQKKPGHEVASALGISLPSVQNIKKVLGLIKKRG